MSPRPRRTPSLLGLFLVVSAVILACGAIVLGAALNRALYDQSVGQTRRVAEGYVDRVLRPAIVHGNRVVARPVVSAEDRRELAHHGSEIVNVKVWSADGTLVWTQLEPRRIGQRYPVGDALSGVLRRGSSSASFVHNDGPDDRAEQIQQLRVPQARLLEVYTPIRGAGGRTIGAYEVYVDAHAALQ